MFEDISKIDKYKKNNIDPLQLRNNFEFKKENAIRIIKGSKYS